MAALQGPVMCGGGTTIAAMHSKHEPSLRLMCTGARANACRSALWGCRVRRVAAVKRPAGNLGSQALTVRACSSSSTSSGGSGSSAEGFSEKDEDYVESSVLEAVEVKSGSEGFLIKMRDGRYIKCVHNNPDGTRLPDYAPQPAIVLKMEDGSDLLLPIIVCMSLSLTSGWLVFCILAYVGHFHVIVSRLSEILYCYISSISVSSLMQLVTFMSFSFVSFDCDMLFGILTCLVELPCTMLMEAVRNVHIARPTIYQVLRNMIELMGYKAKLVRVTRRVQEAYYAQLYLSKQVGEEVQEVSLDLRPSDAINIAARCQVPIQVNRQLAYGDGVRIVSDPARLPSRTQRSGGVSVFTELDRPQTEACIEAEEFVLVRSMLMAAAEERYIDAARIRDELRELRSRKRN